MNILVLTKTYPNPEDSDLDGTTPVVRDFATSWAEAGHQVFVYHNYTKKPGLLNLLPSYVIDVLNKKYGYSMTAFAVTSGANSRSVRYEGDVRIARFPLVKLIPGKGAFGFQVIAQFNRIMKDLKHEGFVPDIIFGHWEDPQLQLLSMLKSVFHVPCVFTCHKIAYLNKTRYLNKAQKWIADIDALFVRSEAIGDQLQDLLNKKEPFPVCRSGIDPVFFERPLPEKVSRQGVLYVGRLVPYKNVDILIEACRQITPKSLGCLRIIGNGPEEVALREIASENVKFLGKRDHLYILNELDNASVLSMVSSNETFGLSYIEAMARGCIVIAGNEGGMRGIIEDGVNGYLCEPGDVAKLRSVFESIEALDQDEEDRIRQNAIRTASEFTLNKQAEKYLNSALSIIAQENVQ